MGNTRHFSRQEGVRDAIIDFADLLRHEGLNIGAQETLESLDVACDPLVVQRGFLKDALRAVCCSSKDEIPTFDRLFDYYWSTGGSTVKNRTTFKNQSNLVKKSNSSLVMMGRGRSEGEEKESKNVSGANQVERLRRTDFSKVSEVESEYLEELALRLWKEMSLRMKRRLKSSPKGSKIDLRRTIRSNVMHGGDVIELKRRSHKPRKQRLVVLLDVSGSMDKYSYFLLRFVWTLRSHFENVEIFIFSTSLIRITEFMHSRNLPATLAVLSAKANNWSSGTKIGECFKAFNEDHAKQILNGQSTVIVLSDGLDTGEPEQLNTELRKIRLRTRKVIWLNPLKGMRGYEPVQRGMSAALEEVDIFRSAHNLNSLLELEDFLMAI